MMAGPEGAIVEEWASYHDGAGLSLPIKMQGYKNVQII